jgi:hypothetical protein
MRILSIHPCGISRVFLHDVKSYDMGPSRFTSHPRGRCAADFYRPQKSNALAEFEPATFWSSGKHTNHYTTKTTLYEHCSSFAFRQRAQAWNIFCYFTVCKYVKEHCPILQENRVAREHSVENPWSELLGYIPTKANGYVAGNGSNDPAILFIIQAQTSALSRR